MAFSTNTLTLLKSLYWILGVSIHLYICYLLLVTSRTITGILWLVFGFMLLWLMYPVYFPPGDPGSQWPPYITACPDYLTLIAPNKCVDYVGLGSPQLQKADPAHPPAVTDTKYVFDATGSLQEKAQKAKQFGLSWEGVV